MSGNKSPAQPSSESISLWTLKLFEGVSSSELGGEVAEHIVLREQGSSPELRLHRTSKYKNVLYKNRINREGGWFVRCSCWRILSRTTQAPKTWIRLPSGKSSQAFSINFAHWCKIPARNSKQAFGQ